MVRPPPAPKEIPDEPRFDLPLSHLRIGTHFDGTTRGTGPSGALPAIRGLPLAAVRISGRIRSHRLPAHLPQHGQRHLPGRPHPRGTSADNGNRREYECAPRPASAGVYTHRAFHVTAGRHTLPISFGRRHRPVCGLFTPPDSSLSG